MLHLTPPANIVSSRQERWVIGALALLWLALQTFWFWQHGVRVMGDSEGYMTYARQIADTFYFAANHQLKYVGYPLFMAAIFKLGFGLQEIIIIQILLSGLATITLYRTTSLLAQNKLAPIIATAIFIGWYDLQMFNGFILTESIYISLIVLAFYFLVKARNLTSTLFILPLLLYIATIRPNGFIMLVAYLGYVVCYLFPKIKTGYAKVMLVVAIVCFLVALVLVVDQYFLSNFTGMVDTYQKGQLIFMYDELIIQPDQPLIMPPVDASPLMKLILFMRYNTAYFFEMAALRFLLFWGNVKPFFSLPHNLLIAIVFYPLYIFTGKVLLSDKVALPLRMFVLLLLGQQAFITAITSEDWNGRFLMSVISLVFIFGATGLSWQIRKYWRRPPIL